MLLPNIDLALVDPPKIKDYLLATSHPQGKGKAKLFLGLGFRRDKTSELHDALLAHAAKNPVNTTVGTQFGTKYVIEGLLFGPTGQAARIRAIWFIETGMQSPKFVTAYPA